MTLNLMKQQQFGMFSSQLSALSGQRSAQAKFLSGLIGKAQYEGITNQKAHRLKMGPD